VRIGGSPRFGERSYVRKVPSKDMDPSYSLTQFALWAVRGPPTIRPLICPSQGSTKGNTIMIDVKKVTALQRDTVVRWHVSPIENPYDGIMAIVCQQHSFNFLLWHEEDIARSPDAGDKKIAQVKRNIDKLNQQRNDWIEKIDDWITGYLDQHGITAAEDATLNTETPGSAFDRLSILSLRIYHMEEQLDRTDASAEHIQSVEKKLAVCHLQLDDLSGALKQLLDGILSGRKRHRTYRQFKMYNDPALNPYLYKSQLRRAG